MTIELSVGYIGRWRRRRKRRKGGAEKKEGKAVIAMGHYGQ